MLHSGFTDFDPTRVTLNVARTGMTGFEFERLLQRDRIYPEMSTLQHVLFLLTPGTRDSDLSLLIERIRIIAEASGERPSAHMATAPAMPQMAVIPRVAKFARKQVVPVAAAAGRIAGETIATYPPGVPLITAGELVSHDVVEYLRYMRASGATLKGASDPSFATMKVLMETGAAPSVAVRGSRS